MYDQRNQPVQTSLFLTAKMQFLFHDQLGYSHVCCVKYAVHQAFQIAEVDNKC